jgi:ParB-like nuclease domain
MEAYSIHPLADIFPLMKEKEIDELASDIKEHGLREPIVLHEGMILDGRNRYHACAKLGIELLTCQWDGNGNPLDYVISKNLHRRHLKEGQRAAIANKIATMKRGDNQHAQICATSQGQAAKMLNVSRRSLQNARVVSEKGVPELQAALESGDVSTIAASAVAQMPKKRQREIVAGGPKRIAAAAKRCKRRRKPGGAAHMPPEYRPETEQESPTSSHIISSKDTSTISCPRSGTHVSEAGFTSADPFELEADHFAAGLLMPSSLFKAELRKINHGLAAIEAMAEKCITSLTATAIRYSELTRAAAAVIVTRGEYVDYCRLSDSIKTLKGLQWIKKGSIVPAETETARLNSAPERITAAKRSCAEIDLRLWLGGERRVLALEEVIGLGNYGRTLTVLTCRTVEDAAYGYDDDDDEERLIESWTPRFRR